MAIPKYTAQRPMEVIPAGAKAWPEMMSRERRAMAGFGGTMMSVSLRWQAERDNAEISRLQSEINNFQYTALRQLENDWRAGKFTNADQFKQAEVDYVKARDRMVSKLVKGKRGVIGDRVSEYAESNKASDTAGFYRNLFSKEKEFRSVEALKVIENYKLQGERDKALMAIEQNKYWLGLTKTEVLKANLDADIESNRIQLLINIDPESAMVAIDATKIFDEGEKNRLRGQARSEIARRQREQSIALQVMREKTMTTMLADFWDGKLKDPQIITDAMRLGYLDDTDAKYLHDAIMNPDPPETTNEALIAIRYAIAGIAEGTETRESAIKKVIAYTQQLSPNDGKNFIKEIFGEHDTKNAFWNGRAFEYMEKQILEITSKANILYGSGEQLALSASAFIAYDLAKKDAAAKDKPLNGVELLELAHQTMMPFREKVKPLMPGEKLPETLIGKPTKAEQIVAFEKRLEKEKYYKFKKVAQPKTKEEYDKLKSGTKYIDPEGVERIKK